MTSRMRRLARKVACGAAGVLAATVLLTACGGGGAEGAPVQGPALTLTAEYFPLAAGDRRSWRTTAGATAGTVRNERVFEATLIGSRTVYPVQDDTGDVTYYERATTAVLQVPAAEDAERSAIGPVTLLRLGQAPGQTDVTLQRTVALDLDGSGRAVPVDLHMQSTFVGFEAVTTAAGTFTDAAHVRTVLQLTVHTAGSPPITVTASGDDWYARGVGPVKNVSVTTSASGTSNYSEEVFAWSVGGRHSEAVAPVLLGANPGDGAYQGAQGPLALQFSEPIDTWSVAGSTGIALFDAAGNPVAVTQTANGDGSQWTLTPTGTLPDGRYTWRVGADVTDLAGNAPAASTGSFVVDTTGPQVVSSQPAAAAGEAALTGEVWVRFNEPVFAVPGAALRLTVFDPFTGSSQQLDATIDGDRVVATLAAPLLRNREYALGMAGGVIADARGNVAYSPVGITFRTDPGPLSRPQPTVPDAADVPLVNVADLDGDGRPDLVMFVQYQGEFDLRLAVRKATPGAGLAAAQEIAHLGQIGWGCRSSPPAMAVMDADGDGRPDILLPCNGGSMVLKQAGDGTFSAERVPPVGTMGAFAVDPDGSGRGHFVILSLEGGTFRANLLGRASDGSWALRSSIDLGPQSPWWLRHADVDGDGRRDLVWLRSDAAGTGTELAWRLAAADGSLGPTQVAALDAGLFAGFEMADLDADGVPELIFSQQYADPSTWLGAARLRVWKRTPAGGYRATQSLALSPSASRVAVADVDGDGHADVIVAQDAAYRVSVLLQSSDGLLEAERLFEAPYGYNQSLAVTDVDGDGRRDLVVGAGVLLGRPTAGSWPSAAAGTKTALRAPTAAPARTPAPAPARAGAAKHGGWTQVLRAALAGR
jgi:hypothetical protein